MKILNDVDENDVYMNLDVMMILWIANQSQSFHRQSLLLWRSFLGL